MGPMMERSFLPGISRNLESQCQPFRNFCGTDKASGPFGDPQGEDFPKRSVALPDWMAAEHRVQGLSDLNHKPSASYQDRREALLS